MSLEQERGFYFAAMTLREGLIDPAGFTEACTEWASRGGASLADVLSERANLSPGERDRLLRLVESEATAGAATRAPACPGNGSGGTDTRPLASEETLAYDPRAAAGSSPPPPTTAGRDRYHLHGPPLLGGIGQVWRARDARLGRDVALKELRPEQRHRGVTEARFLDEARVTSQLGHPGIVPVYDLDEGGPGEASERGPFYTMRFVEGRTLATACRDCHASGASRLDLLALLNAFVAVCNAVAYAHSRGVIHRDLKGSNVVLGSFGEVLLIDWGLAKLVDGGDEDGGGCEGAPRFVTGTRDVGSDDHHVALTPGSDRGDTMPGYPVGTPTHMAPEQADGRLDAIGRQTDVYGLGTLLYEVLTGRPPFHGPGRAATLEQARRSDPPRPSSLNPGVPPALEAVCRKAMTREPAGRYGSAAELAGEVQRYLADEPVRAYSEPWPARVGRWARHHKSWVAASAALLTAAVVGLAVFAGLTERQRLLLVDEQARTERARREADAHFRTAVGVVDAVLTPVFDVRLAGVPQMEPLRRRLARDASGYYQEFVRLRPDDPPVLHAASKVFRREANVDRQLGRFDRAMEGYDRAVALLERLNTRFPGDLLYRDHLAETDGEAAELLRMQGRPRDAALRLQRVLAVARSLQADRPSAPEYRRTEGRLLSSLGEVEADQGRFPEAREALARSAELLRGLTDGPKPGAADGLLLVLALTQQAEAFRLSGQPGPAGTAASEAVARARSLLATDPADNNRRFVLAAALGESGLALHAEAPARRAEALAALDESSRLLAGLATDFPSTPNYRQRQARILEARGRVRLAAGRVLEAEEDWTASRTVLETLVKEVPGSFVNHALLGAVLGDLGRLALDRSAYDEAVRLLDDALTEDGLALSHDPSLPAPSAARARHKADRDEAARKRSGALPR